MYIPTLRIENERVTAMNQSPVGVHGRLIGGAVTLLFLVAALFGGVSANAMISVCALLMPVVLWRLLWHPGHPAVLLFAVLFQWAQVFAPILAANMEGRTLYDVFQGPELEEAAWLSLGSVLILALGMCVGKRLVKQVVPAHVLAGEALPLSINRLMVAYVLASAFSVLCLYVSNRAGSLRQPILAFTALKWYPIFLIIWTTLLRRRQYLPLMTVVVIEVVLGFTGYFSNFKSIFFMLLVVGIGAVVHQSRVKIAPLLLTATAVLVLTLFWQAIKSDYRRFLNQGTGKQVILVPVTERLAFLAKAAFETTPESMWNGAFSGLERLGYIDYFAYSIRNVPSRIPYENGNLWIGAVKHTFMPRLFFPTKPTLNESERTNKYTLMAVAGEEQGTAISIGYPGESYIDFGPVWMFVPILLLGVFFGLIYEKLSNWGPYYLSGTALASSLLLFSAHQIEASNIKLVGGVSTGLLAFIVFQRFVVPYIWPLLCEPTAYRDFNKT